MKKRLRQILKSPAYLVMAFVTLTIICPNASLSQTEPPNTHKSDIWELNYMVSVYGSFHVEPELGSGNPDAYYKIDRNYEGRAKLVFTKSNAQRLAFADPSTTQVDIQINDTRKEIGDPTCEEYLTVDETWEGQMSTLTGNPKFHPLSQLLIDNEKRNYKTSFHIAYVPNKNQYDIAYTKISTIKTNSGGTKGVAFSPVQHLRYPDYGNLPNVKGYIEENKVIVHTLAWSELKKRENFIWGSRVSNLNTRDRLIWVSAVLHPDEPLMEGVPESKDEVSIIIKYTLQRVKG